ncbi:hypothetical protein GH714_030518 [Hevea brasiliensis]|uniref:Alpha-carbonic anhydrase domain-containing protein n=1 Tax=Hevea brasiliensis TaxID=3981 RepID=A0A6A6M6S7_HEVBR|nr:hypothetical protein GH714_030518 [Hevea brasiliensis]
MAPRISFSILALALFLAVASAGIAAAPPKELSAPFTYYGPKGSSKWGNLSPEYSACSKGKIQSPININRNETVHNKNLKPLIREYKPANATLVTNVCNIGVSSGASPSPRGENNATSVVAVLYQYGRADPFIAKTRTVTEKQVQTLKAPLGIAYKVNERPLQALNGRKVELFKEFQLPKPART